MLPAGLARQSGLRLSDFAHVIGSRRASPAKRAENLNNACSLMLSALVTAKKMAEKSKKQKTTSSKSKTKNLKKIDDAFSFDVIHVPAKIFTPGLEISISLFRNLRLVILLLLLLLLYHETKQYRTNLYT